MSINPRFEDMGQLRDKLVAIFREWNRELRAFVRDSPFGAPDNADDLVAVEFRDGEIAFIQTAGGVRKELGSVRRQESGEFDTAASLVAAVSELPEDKRDIRLIFPDSRLLRAGLRMPSAPSGRLRKALHYELPRLSPLDPEQLYFDFAVGAPDAQTKKCDIALRIIRRTFVEEAVAICHAAGLKIAAIGFANDSRDADWRYFPADRNAVARHLWKRWGVLALSAAALILIVALTGAIYARGVETLDDISDRIQTEKARAAVVQHIEHEITMASAAASFLNEQKRQPMLIAVLAEITRTLPDGTWLTEIQMKGQTVRIQGYSPNASDLIALIDKTPFFENAQFESPMIQNQANNTERFDFSFKVKEGAR